MSVTVGEWLALRADGVPPQLVAEVRSALGPDLGRDAAEIPERCVTAAERIVASLLRDGRTQRESALALLAADALVTYAFEAAADAPASIAARARDAMHLLSATA